jgi:hypothetical protein
MNELRKWRPSTTMIVVAIALTGVLATTAIAGPGAITSTLTKSKVKAIAKKQANKQISRRAPGLSVASAQTAQSAGNAQNADKLDGLDSGQFQGRVRWALVGDNQIITQSGGITLESDAQPGEYYFDFGEQVTGKGILATTAYEFSGSDRVNVQTAPCDGDVGEGADCNGPFNDSQHVFVFTTAESGSTYAIQDSGFYVAVIP